ncbi:MAG: DUF4404 family protein [Pirellulaceae bacterium]
MTDRLATVRVLLADLVAELRQVDQLDEPTRQQLAEAASEMIAALHRGEGDQSAAKQEGDASLQDRIVEFETSHPNLAAVMHRLIDILGQMGI